MIRGSVFEFFSATRVMVVIILSRGSQTYQGVAPTSQGGFGVTKFRVSTSIPCHHLGSSLDIQSSKLEGGRYMFLWVQNDTSNIRW
jgi:hypothetical protein